MHVDGVLVGHLHPALVGDPIRVLLRDPGRLLEIVGGEHAAPALGIDHVGALHARIEVLEDLEAAVRFLGVLLGLGDDLGHELELGRPGQADVGAVAGQQQDQALRHAERLLVAGGVRIAHVDGQAFGVALVLDDRLQIGQRLERVVPVALHVEHRRAAGLGHRPDVVVADAPVDLADGDPVVVAAQDLADLLPGVAVPDLGGGAVEEHGVPAQLGHSGFEAGPGSGAGEEEEHCQHLVVEVGVGFAEGPLALQVEGDVHDGVELVPGPLLSGDHVLATQVCLHLYSLIIGPRSCA